MRKLGLFMVLFALSGFVVGCGGDDAKDKKNDGEKKQTEKPDKKDDTPKPDDTTNTDDTTNGKTDDPPTDDGVTTDAGMPDPPADAADGEKPKSSLKSIFGALRKGATDGITGEGDGG
jgi:hypothetical protein